jgi:DNA-binding transcriptional MerR regulator
MMSQQQTSYSSDAEKQATEVPAVIGEEEAAHCAGVSVATLHCFEEVGSLSAVVTTEGRAYPIADIERLFSITVGRPRHFQPRKQPESFTDNASSISVEEAPQHSETILSSPLPEEEVVEESSFQSNDRGAFKKVLSTLQRLIEGKDAEIADLKNQRAWLQQRIEKLEQQSDRDRLLLLSESHTIKQLVAIEANRKSKLRATLEFFGIVPVQEPMPAPGPLSLDFTSSQRLADSQRVSDTKQIGDSHQLNLVEGAAALGTSVEGTQTHEDPARS